jgi:hypothetical protein
MKSKPAGQTHLLIGYRYCEEDLQPGYVEQAAETRILKHILCSGRGNCSSQSSLAFHRVPPGTWMIHACAIMTVNVCDNER